MKLYSDCKKLSSSVRALGSSESLKLSLIVILLFFPIAFLVAQTVSDIQNKINERDADIAQLEKEIAAYQTQLDSLGQQKNSLSNSLKELDLTQKKLNADIAITQNKINKTNLKIQNLSSDISDKQKSIDIHLDSIELEIKNINEFEQRSLVESILSDDNFSIVWNDIDNIISVQEKIREDAVALKKIKGTLENTRAATIEAKNELTKLKSQLSDQKKIVVQNTNEKNKLLKQTKNSEANYQKLLKDKLAKKEAFEKELYDYEMQLKYILDPSKLPSKGVLSWPLDSVYMTSSYGPRSDGFHYGVDFRARSPVPVYAMADGTVAGVGDTDTQCAGVSFGRFILIKYDDGLASTFGHLSLIKVSAGQRVKRGQLVGYTGNTGYSTGPHLHVAVYAKDAVEIKNIPSKSCSGRILTQPVSPINGYLNPMYYLPSL